jgi:hypothetical protein
MPRYDEQELDATLRRRQRLSRTHSKSLDASSCSG